ncbi:hypothetical protein SISSUDRAFT_1038127 [Sistotremastrum suecicum HHB10207 ss-3]|uniref:Uncharacterized protein n=1 Tax=Sistotremastrum suecicum HHB10207 ss-3 TaxID=1314776 RepID=A0A165X6W5_9AGAM|nr:hypothetical protein SISSUDRAFT_1038127 [Sistotremastrum suecicum HHB10207 ss-3]
MPLSFPSPNDFRRSLSVDPATGNSRHSSRENLLPRPDPSRPACDPSNPLHCQLAAWWTDEFWISTPNANHIPQPPTIPNSLTVSPDGHLGQADFAKYPQHYNRELPHLAFLPTAPTEAENHDLPWVIFVTIHAEDFIFPDPTRQPSQVGQLNSMIIKDLETRVSWMSQVIEESIQHWRPERNLGPVAVHARQLKALMLHCLHRLQTLFLPFTQTSRTFVNCQRCWLELYALREYMSLFGPDSASPSTMRLPRAPLRSCIGTFVDNQRDLELLFNARVPVWYIRARQDLASPHDIRIRQIVSLSESYLGIATTQNPDRDDRIDLATRSMRVPQVREAIYAEAWSGAREEDPGASMILTIPDAVPDRHLKRPKSSGAVENGGGPPSKKKKPRTPATPLDETILPPSIPAWVDALARNPTPPSSGHERSTETYILPHPSWFTTVYRDKQDRYFINWLSIRQSWLEGMDAHTVSPISSRMWKDFLSHSPERGPLNPDQNHLPHSPIPAQDAHTQAKRKRVAARLADRERSQSLFSSMIADVWTTECAATIEWYDRRLFSASAEADRCTRGLILAELSEIAFLWELEHLNGLMRAETDKETAIHCLRSRLGRESSYNSATLPRDLQASLASPTLVDKLQILEPIRQIIAGWPEAPASVKQALTDIIFDTPAVLKQLHTTIADEYVRQFVKWMGRHPSVPTGFPDDTDTRGSA